MNYPNFFSGLCTLQRIIPVHISHTPWIKRLIHPMWSVVTHLVHPYKYYYSYSYYSYYHYVVLTITIIIDYYYCTMSITIASNINLLITY